jgi:hypothetical protein
MFRDEACLPAIATNSAEAPRAFIKCGTSPMRLRQKQSPLLARHETMRSYIVTTAIAIGLLAVWAAIVPFVA